MLIYFIFLCLFILFRQLHVKEKQGIILLSLFLIFVMGMRNWNMGISDTMTYYKLFLHCQTQSISEMLSNPPFTAEPLMSLYMWSTAKLFPHFAGFVLLSAMLFIWPISQYVIRQSDDPYLSLLYFYSLYYFFGSYLIKQTITMGLLVYAFHFYLESKRIQFIVICLACTLIHKYSWVFLLMIPLEYLLKKTRRKLFLFIMIVSIGILVPSVLTDAVILLDPTRLLGKYMSYGIYNANAARMNLGTAIYLLISVAGILLEGEGRLENEDYSTYLAIAFAAAIFSSYSTIIQEFYRIAMFYGIFNCIFISKIMSVLKRHNKIKYAVIMTYAFLVVYSFRTMDNTNCSVYSFFFQ